MSESRTVCLFGGTGFVGRRLTQTLLNAGFRVTVVSRQPARHKDLKVTAEIDLIEGDIYSDASLKAILRDQDVVVNLVGILNERPRNNETFERVHNQLPRRIASACVAQGVQRLLHMSSLGAAEDAPSEYLKSKARGRNAVAEEVGDRVPLTVFQPSVVFGPGDGFTRLFAGLLRSSPVLPLACPKARFQPVFVDDVVNAMVASIDMPETFGQTYELAGPTQYSFYELVKKIAEMAGTHSRIVRLSNGLSRLQARIMQFVPGKPFTPDNYQSLQIDSVSDKPFPELFGITPTALEDVAPRWLSADTSHKRAHRYDTYRRAAGR